MIIKLSQPQRVLASIIYLLILFVIYYEQGDNFENLVKRTSDDSSLWFISGALLIVLGKYLAEPFFTKPTDAIANSTAVIIALLSLDNKEVLLGYDYILYTSIGILIISLVSIAFIDSVKYKTVQKACYIVCVYFGSSRFMFSIVFLPAAYSHLIEIPDPKTGVFILLVTFWICIVFFDVVGKTIELINKMRNIAEINKHEIGKAIGCENHLIYNAEIDNAIATKIGKGSLVSIEFKEDNRSLGVVIEIRHLLEKKWITIHLITDKNGDQVEVASTKQIFGRNSILATTNSLFHVSNIDDLRPEVKSKVEESYIYANREGIVGYVERGSNLNTLRFRILTDIEQCSLSEGSIVTASVKGERALFQIIDGTTYEESLENKDSHGYTIGVARKVGRYDSDDMEVKVVGWLPEMFEPVFLMKENGLTEEEESALAQSTIGLLPRTRFGIPIKNYDSIVTHNTAILGILGIGKSCLTFELIKKLLANTDTKIICVDITNQYDSELRRYVDENLIKNDFTDEEKADLRANNRIGDNNNPNSWGNEELYNTKLVTLIDEFSNSDARILILNPDWHQVSKAGSKFNITHKVDLTVAEKTRAISNKVFMQAYGEGETINARYLLVFEEAHALVPEWSSIANEGDKAAVNGTAKVILQGRKFGLGSLVITQRTANISKSILNQCNTIFALRVFDDTGKQFLENYIGADYANTLPTLEERHAICVGKAMKLKQPIIVKLNDRKYVSEDVTEAPEEEEDDLLS